MPVVVMMMKIIINHHDYHDDDNDDCYHGYDPDHAKNIARSTTDSGVPRSNNNWWKGGGSTYFDADGCFCIFVFVDEDDTKSFAQEEGLS